MVSHASGNKLTHINRNNSELPAAAPTWTIQTPCHTLEASRPHLVWPALCFKILFWIFSILKTRPLQIKSSKFWFSLKIIKSDHITSAFPQGWSWAFPRGPPLAVSSFASFPNLIVPRHQGQRSAASSLYWCSCFSYIGIREEWNISCNHV